MDWEQEQQKKWKQKHDLEMKSKHWDRNEIQWEQNEIKQNAIKMK